MVTESDHAGGMDWSDAVLTKTIEILKRGIDSGLHLGAQIYVSLKGDVVCDESVGQSRVDVPMTNDTLMLWMSAGKPVTAIAIGQFIDREKLSLETKVAEIVTGFEANGKGDIRVRHLLDHTAGFRGPMNSFTPGPWEEVIKRVCGLKQEPNWVPGEKGGYHIASSWFTLAEIVRRIDGRAIDRYAREEIYLPLGLSDAWIGIPQEKISEYGTRIALCYDTTRDWADDSLPQNTEEAIREPRPAANARGPISALGRIYECLMHGGSPILSDARTREFTSRQRAGMIDQTFKAKIDWGFGFMIDSKRYGQEHPYGYGPHASDNTFGHSGNQSSCAFCDPDRQLVVAWACNGLPGEAKHQERQSAINASVYEELGLT